MKLNRYILPLLLILGLPAGLFAVPDTDSVDSTGVVITSLPNDDMTIEDSAAVEITDSASIVQLDSIVNQSSNCQSSNCQFDSTGVPESSVGDFGEKEEQGGTLDSIEATSADSVPTWYVEPVIPIELRSPMRTTASGCLTDSILTFNVDSVLTEATTYDYDAAGRTIRTTVWTYNADGSRIGKSKQEYAFDANGTQIYTGTFAWDATTNDWKGTSKSEFVYNEAHQIESNITYTWVNNTWLPSQALTYAYDAAGRETEYTTYTRNASVNHLVPSKCRLQTWYNASKKYQEINYTAYANGAWSAGTKKEYDYDSNGNQIEYTYYSSYANGNWVGSTHELWTYNTSNKKTYYEKQTWSSGTWVNSSKELWEFNSSNKQTLHEKYTGSGSNWTITLREISGYDAAGNNTLVENYSLTSNVWKGTKKEEYTYNSAKKKIGTITYKWINSEWVYNVWTVSGYDAAGNLNESCKYNWKNEAWVGSGTRTLRTYNNSKKVIEQIIQSWSSSTNCWLNTSKTTTDYQGTQIHQEISYEWIGTDWVNKQKTEYIFTSSGKSDVEATYQWVNSQWENFQRVEYTYDARGNQILKSTTLWNATDSSWVVSTQARVEYQYNEAGLLLHYATYTGKEPNWVGSSRIENTYDENNNQLTNCTYVWGNGGWVYSVLFEYAYDDQNRQTMNRRSVWTNGAWEGTSWYETSFDSNNYLNTNASYVFRNGQWVGESKMTYVYDANGTCLNDVYYSWSNGDWIPSMRHSYVYDAQGRKVEDVLERYTSGVWTNDTRLTYGYDARGNKIIDNKDLFFDGGWHPESISEKEYDQVDNKLRRDIYAYYSSYVVRVYTDKHYHYSCDAPTNNNGSQPRTPTGTEEDAEYTERILDNNNENTLITTQPVYNLQGQRVDPATYHGVVIQNGKKFVL